MDGVDGIVRTRVHVLIRTVVVMCVWHACVHVPHRERPCMRACTSLTGKDLKVEGIPDLNNSLRRDQELLAEYAKDGER